jgi:hypothetical protein
VALEQTALPPTLSPYEARERSSPKKAAGATLKDLETPAETTPKTLSAQLRIGCLDAGCNVGFFGAESGSRKIRFLS